MHDVIRRGLIVDGNRAEPFEDDAIEGRKITQARRSVRAVSAATRWTAAGVPNTAKTNLVAR